MMTGTSERENFPTFQSVWDTGTGKDGSQRKLQVWNDNSDHHEDAEKEEKKSEEDSDTKKSPNSRYSLFSPGLSARALWSVSSSDDKAVVEAWKCEECGHENYNENDGECECCGTGICFMDERRDTLGGRQLFVEEYGVDDDEEEEPPATTKSPTSPKTTTSLRELLSRHPSFQAKNKKQDEKSLLSWGSATTTPTTNLSPASAFSPASLSPSSSNKATTTSPEIKFVDTNKALEVIDKVMEKEEEGMVSFNKDFRDEEHDDMDKSRRRLRSFMCFSPPILVLFLGVGIMCAIWIPVHNKKPLMADNNSGLHLTDGLWVQQGEQVFGDEPDYQTGASVALASGGRVMAVGVGKFGPVRVYNNHLGDSGEWLPMGQDIALGDGPKHVALSRRHGHTLAVASESDGSVAVFAYDKDTYSWGPLGEELLFGVTNRDDARASVSLSDSGKVIAVGLPSEGSLRSDSVRILGYEAETDTWIPVGEDIVLDLEPRIQHGGSVSLSTNGMVVAVGSWAGVDDRAGYASHAEVYRFFNNTWQQVGGKTNIGPRMSPVNSDTSVSLSGDGSIVAIGSGFRCRMFQFNEEKQEWSQLGQDLVGSTVSLSENGKVLAVGNAACDDHGSDSGEAVIYVYDDAANSWEEVGEKIPGEVEGGLFGAALSLSHDGKRVAVGSPGSGESAQNSGSASVFELELE